MASRWKARPTTGLPTVHTGARADDALCVPSGGVRTSRIAMQLAPGPRHLDLVFGLLRDLGTAGNLTTGVQLAALAIKHQAELHSTDADFARMKGLRWANPLAGV